MFDSAVKNKTGEGLPESGVLVKTVPIGVQKKVRKQIKLIWLPYEIAQSPRCVFVFVCLSVCLSVSLSVCLSVCYLVLPLLNQRWT